MADSLIGKYEAEIKCRIPDPDEAIEKIRQIGAIPRFIRNVERDICFDFPNGHLTRQGRHLILRSRLPYGEFLLMLKDRKKQVVELVSVDNYDTALRLLKECGFVEVQRLEKIRSMFLKDYFHITVDSIEGHGHFIEIGSMTNATSELESLEAEEIELLESFGYDRADQELRSYHEFVQEK